MHKYITFIFIPLFLLVSIPVVVPAATQRGIFPVPIKDRSGNQVLLYQESHALLVGVCEYTKGWPNLPGVKEDINEDYKYRWSFSDPNYKVNFGDLPCNNRFLSSRTFLSKLTEQE